MKDLNQLPSNLKDRTLTWLFILVLRMSGLNIYDDNSAAWSILDSKDTSDIDQFFSSVLEKYIQDNLDKSRSLKKIARDFEIKSRFKK